VPIAHRPRSSSTSSVGAGSPPRNPIDSIGQLPWIGSILGLAIIIIVVKCKSGFDISSILGNILKTPSSNNK